MQPLSFDCKRLLRYGINAGTGAVIMLALSLPAGPAAAQENVRVQLGAGFDYSSGDYGQDQDTDILYIPITAQIDWDRFRAKVTVPYIDIKGPGGVVGGDAPIIIGPGGPERGSASGLGDVWLSLSYILITSGDTRPFVELEGKVKLPTANENKGLGTGETDFSVQVNLAKTFGNVTPFATVGYRVFGDPEGIELKNTVLASGGANFKLSEDTSVGGLLDYREATTAASEERLEIVPYVNWTITGPWSLNVYGVFGLSDGSPDSGAGAQIKYNF